MKLAKYNKYFISTPVTDDVMLQHQGIIIISRRAEDAPMRFQLIRG